MSLLLVALPVVVGARGRVEVELLAVELLRHGEVEAELEVVVAA